jgi:hypothetical protein
MHHIMNNDIDLTDEIDDPDRTVSVIKQGNRVTPHIILQDHNRVNSDCSNPLNQLLEC